MEQETLVYLQVRYSCTKEDAPHTQNPPEATATKSPGSSPKTKAKSPPKSPPPKSPPPGLSDEESLCRAEDVNTFKLIVFDTLTDHKGIDSGTGLNPTTFQMQLLGDGWHEVVC